MKPMKLKDLRLSESLIGVAAILKTLVNGSFQEVVYAIVGNDVILYWGGKPETGTALSEMIGRIILEHSQIQNLNIRICRNAMLKVDGNYNLIKEYTKSGDTEICHLDNPYLVDYLLNTRDASGERVAATRLAA